MRSLTDHIVIHTANRRELLNITDRCRAFVKRAEIDEGLFLVCSMDVTSTVFMTDSEPGVKADILKWFQENVNEEGDYEHHYTGEMNGPAYIKSMLLGQNVVLPVTNGVLELGSVQEIVYAEWDGKQDKTITLKVIGD